MVLAGESSLISGGALRLSGTRQCGLGAPVIHQNCLGMPTAHTWEVWAHSCWRTKPPVLWEAWLVVQITECTPIVLIGHACSLHHSLAFWFAWDLDLVHYVLRR